MNIFRTLYTADLEIPTHPPQYHFGSSVPDSTFLPYSSAHVEAQQKSTRRPASLAPKNKPIWYRAANALAFMSCSVSSLHRFAAILAPGQ